MFKLTVLSVGGLNDSLCTTGWVVVGYWHSPEARFEGDRPHGVYLSTSFIPRVSLIFMKV